MNGLPTRFPGRPVSPKILGRLSNERPRDLISSTLAGTPTNGLLSVIWKPRDRVASEKSLREAPVFLSGHIKKVD